MASSTGGTGAAPIRPSFTQVIASAMAAVSAAVISSTFGVAGTLIGAGIASVIASVGSTLYLASLRNTNERLRRLATARRPDGSAIGPSDPSTQADEPLPAPAVDGPSRWNRLRWSQLRRGLPSLRRRWRTLAVLTLAVFGLAIATITVVEASTNKPVSALIGGGNRSGTSLGDVLDHKSKASPSPTPTPTPSASVSGQPGAKASPTASPSTAPPTVPSPSSSKGQTPEPTPSPSATVSLGLPVAPVPPPATVP